MSRRQSPTTDAVLAILAGGPRMRGEIEQLLGKSLQATIYALKKQRKIHVHGWMHGTGNMRSLRMIYALGDQPDAPRPPADHYGKFRRYYQKHKAKIKEKRKLNYHRYAKKAAAAQQRLRAKKRLKNPFIQLNKEIFNDLRRRASKAVQGKRIQRRPAKAVGDGGRARRAGD